MKNIAKLLLVAIAIAGSQEAYSMYINTTRKNKRVASTQILLEQQNVFVKDITGKLYDINVPMKNKIIYSSDIINELYKQDPNLKKKVCSIVRQGKIVGNITQKELSLQANLHLITSDNEV